MSKSRARLLAELLNSAGRVKKDKSDLAGADSVIDLDTLPTITNAKLENSSVTIAGEAVSLGASLSLNTGHISEHTNYKYYTDARVRAAISVDGSLSYNSSTGVFSYTTPTTIASLSNHDTADLAEGTNLYYTDARARGAISVSGNALSYNSSTGVISSSYEENPVFTTGVSIEQPSPIFTLKDTTDDDDHHIYFKNSVGSVVYAIETQNATSGDALTLYSASQEIVQRIGTTNIFESHANIVKSLKNFDVTGNITVSGTVDGRDIASDGSKLDGIESGATADQTQSDINALGITATGLSGTPNISVGTISSGTVTTDGEVSVSPSTGTAKVRLTSQGSGSEVFSINGQRPGVSNTGFAIRNETDSRNDFMLDGGGNATFVSTITGTYFLASGADTTPAGTTFANAFNGGTRVAYFDGDATVSTWYGSGNTPYAAVDATNGVLKLYVNDTSGNWHQKIGMTSSGVTHYGSVTSTGVINKIDSGSYATFEADGNTNEWKWLRLSTNGTTAWDIAARNDDLSNALQFRPGGGATNRTYMDTSGNWVMQGSVEVNSHELRVTSSNAYHTHLNYQNSGQNYISQATSGGLTQFRNSNGSLMEIAASGNVTIANDLTVSGNLTISGTTTTLNTATLQVEDKNIVLNYGTGDTSGSADGAGITIQDAVNSTTNATILWSATADQFDFSHKINISGNLQSWNVYSQDFYVLNTAGDGWHKWGERASNRVNLNINSLETYGASYLTGGSSTTPAVHIRSSGSSWSEGMALHPSSDSGYALTFFRTKSSYTDQTNTWAIGNLGSSGYQNYFGLLRKGLTGGVADRTSDALFTVSPSGTFKFGFNPYVGSNKIWHAGNDGSGSGLDADTLDSYHASTTRNSANTIPVRDSNGYLNLGWINTTSGVTTTASSDYYVNTADGYIRKKTLANVKTEIMGVSSGSSFLRSDATDVATGKITLQYGETSDLNSVGGSRGVTAFHTANVGQTSNRPDSGNYATGLEFTYYDASARSQLAAGSGGSNNTAAFYVRSEAWSATNSWTSWYKLFHTGNDGSGSGLDADTVDGVHATSFLRSDAADTASGNLTFTGNISQTGGAFLSHGAQVSSLTTAWQAAGTGKDRGLYPFRFQNGATGQPEAGDNAHWGLNIYAHSGSSGNYPYGTQLSAGSTQSLWHRWWANGSAQGWRKIWDSANDGTGSGLDADTLDGQHGSYYQPASTAITTANIGSQSVSSASNIDGVGFTNTGSNSGTNANTIDSNGISYYTSGVDNFSGNATDGALFSQRYSSNWQHQIAGDYRSGQIALRGKNNGTWQSWRKVWDASNDGSGSGLDADLLDGQHGSYYEPANGTIFKSRGTVNVTTSSGGSNSNPFDDAHTETKVAEYGARLISYTGASATMLTINTGGSASVFQIGAHYNGNDFYMRTRTDSSNWQTWKKLWHAGNDGTGSGLDADTVDGIQGSSFLRSDAGSTVGNVNISFTGTPSSANIIRFDNASGQTMNSSSGYLSRLEVRQPSVNTDAFMSFHIAGDYAAYFGLDGSTNDFSVGGWSMGANKYKVWHAGNDGTGSGLDADTVDGKHKDFLMHYKGIVSGNWDTIFSQTDGHMGVYEVQNINNTDSNYPTGSYTYGGVLSWQLDNSTFKLYAPHTGTLWYQTGWNNDEYSGWRKIWDNGNDGSGSGLDADLLDGVQGSSYLRSDTNQTFTGDLTIDGSSGWNSGNGMLNVGGTGDARLQVRHIWGKSSTSAGTDHLWLNYANSGKHVQIGGSGSSGNDLYVAGTIYANGYFTGNRVLTTADEGSGQGLDADTVDGIQGSQFLRSDAGDTATGNIVFSGATQYFRKNDATNYTNGSLMVESYGGSSSIAAMGFHISGQLGRMLSMNSAGTLNWEDDVSISGSYFTPNTSANGLKSANGNNFFLPLDAYNNMHIRSTTGSEYHDSTAYYFRKVDQSNLVTITASNTNIAAGTLTRGGNTVWDAGNDGSGSGLDADLLDGMQFVSHLGAGKRQTFTVYGDTDKYYPMVISGNASHISTYKIHRGYSEHGPNDWYTSSHKGGLSFMYNIMGSSGWGGYPTRIHVIEAGEIYSSILGGIALTAHSMKHVVWLRGGGSGGARYHIDSPTDFTLEVNSLTTDSTYKNSTDGWYSYNHSNDSYDVTVNYRTLTERNTAMQNEIFSNMDVYFGNGTVNHQLYGAPAPNKTYLHTANEGSGNGIDADTVDGIEAAAIMQLSATQTITGTKYFQSAVNTSSNNPPLQAYSSGGNGAIMSFHRGGVYAINMGLDSDNIFRIGGWSASTNRLQMDMSGNLTMAGNVTAYSDIRLKENIKVIPNALHKVEQLRGVTFTRNDVEDVEKLHTGVIAQEVEVVLPEAVSEDNNGIKNVAYGNMVGLLIEAVKELKQEVEDLKTQLKER